MQRMKKTGWIALGMAAAMAVVLTGCGERMDNENTTTEAKTEAIVVEATEEAVTEIQIETQPATEAVTEAVTEAPPVIQQTEPPTEPPTESTEDLPADQELAQESELAAPVTYYANDDLNVRDTPSTESADSIISSYDQGQEVTVIAKTPHWYKVQKEDYTGYVHKRGISETLTEPKTDEEREQQAQEMLEQAEQTQQQAPEQPADSSVQQTLEPVSNYADSFPIQLKGNANVRASASETADVIGVVDSGSQMTALGESGDWYQVDYNGNVGYVNKNLVA